MRPATDGPAAPRRAARGARLAGLVVAGLAPWLLACAPSLARSPAGAPAAASAPAKPAAASAVAKPSLLGVSPRRRCYHVTREAADQYRFVVDEVRYPGALRAGRVGIIVHALGFGDLAPVPIEKSRDPRLEFVAHGEAGGAFELTLFLVDTDGGRASEPTLLSQRCPSKQGH